MLIFFVCDTPMYDESAKNKTLIPSWICDSVLYSGSSELCHAAIKTAFYRFPGIYMYFPWY